MRADPNPFTDARTEHLQDPGLLAPEPGWVALARGARPTYAGGKILPETPRGPIQRPCLRGFPDLSNLPDFFQRDRPAFPGRNRDRGGDFDIEKGIFGRIAGFAAALHGIEKGGSLPDMWRRLGLKGMNL